MTGEYNGARDNKFNVGGVRNELVIQMPSSPKQILSSNLDPGSIQEKITDKTKAILIIHVAGNLADMDAIMAIAKTS